MKVVWKYELNKRGIVFAKMPLGAEILSIQAQNNVPCIWALVDPEAELTDRAFETLATGEKVEDDNRRKYIGTYQMYGGEFVFHCFELLKK
ncbi:DUF7352 domain-containing protein [Sphingobacterium yanglingense]|uniref:DUF7352 domain-containing protein n=1 Tax=Sphingobacterium yanglingense TaxID=1437280 RepID=A0A4R6WN92_9SPHI|nr:hypothetical protein [Sphingobacterium yanglingense]TDQ79571.1 hypothetical protein CLV99_1016 [Sphingobacterium yanglingense]